MHYYVRDEYRSMFGRQVLTVWSGGFASQWEGEAVALPNGDGFMVRTYSGKRIRVTCDAPRDDDNYRDVDAAINGALIEHHEECDDAGCLGDCMCEMGASSLGSQIVCKRCGRFCECYVCAS